MFSRFFLWLLGKKEGFDMAANRRFVRQTQYWSTQQIAQYQNEKLQELIQHAYHHVPYYHDYFKAHGLLPEDIKTIADLSKIDVIHKIDVQNHPEHFMADNASEFHPIRHHTGGTTGIPFVYYNDRKSWALNWALKMRTFEWGGYSYGIDRLGVMAGGSLTPKKNMGWKHYIWRWINNYYTMPISHMTGEIMSGYVVQLRKQKIKFLRGYPSALVTFAEYILKNKIELSMKAVFTTAEMLYPHQRKIIESAFQCKVFDVYGCGDGMGQATECENHKGMHVCFETSIMQMLDANGNEVKEGDVGEIVLTSLNDYAMPLIRYAPGDMALKASSGCDCGRNMPMIEKIIGRSSDVFRLSNGRILNGLSIPFEELSQDLKQFQIVQESENRVVIYVIPKYDLSDVQKQSILNIIQFHCGDGIVVELQVVDHIEVPISEKFRYIVSKIN